MDSLDLKKIENNKSEYGQFYDKINFIKKEQVNAFEKKRNDLLKDISENIHYLAKSSKLYTQKISYGCELCSLGTWSCLFINGICNAKCFFCPSIQNQKDVPTTNGTKFTSPDDYVNYIEKFSFKGVSLSGGEPFLTYDTTKLFIKKIKKKFSDKI